MIIQIVALLLVLAYAYFQMKQGLFASLIMAICCLFAAGISMNTYQWLADVSGLSDSRPKIADATFLAVSFLASLFILRFLADKFIKGDIIFALPISWGGGAVLGLFSGAIMMGILISILNLMPMGRSITGYQPFNDDLTPADTAAVFKTDSFVAGIGEIFSAGSMGTNEQPDELNISKELQQFCLWNDAGLGGSCDTPEDALKILGVYNIKRDDIPANPLLSHGDTKTIVIRTSVDINTSDTDDWWRLPATHYALKSVVKRDRKPSQYRLDYPVAYLTFKNIKEGMKLHTRPGSEGKKWDIAKLAVQRDKNAGDAGTKGLIIDWIYRIPDNAKPIEMIFRGKASAKVGKIKTAMPIKNVSFLTKSLQVELTEEEKKQKKRQAKAKKSTGSNLKKLKNRNDNIMKDSK